MTKAEMALAAQGNIQVSVAQQKQSEKDRVQRVKIKMLDVLNKSRRERETILGPKWHKIFNNFLVQHGVEPNDEISDESSDLSFDLEPITD